MKSILNFNNLFRFNHFKNLNLKSILKAQKFLIFAVIFSALCGNFAHAESPITLNPKVAPNKTSREINSTTADGRAIDATLEVVKKANRLPSILIQNIGIRSDQMQFSPRVAKMLGADLKVSSHFSVFEDEKPISPTLLINFDDYKVGGIDLIARVSAEQNPDGLLVKLQLYDVNSGTLALSKDYINNEPASYPFTSHAIAIDINNYIKAPRIDWMNKMVLVSYYTTSGNSDIICADYTLTYRRRIITGGLNIFPKWANKEQTSFYFTKYLNKPTLYRYDFATNERTKLFDSNGMLVVSDVSNDGTKLLVSMAPSEQSDIYMYNTTTNRLSQITRYRGIDVSANFIENESRIMFVSDRAGYPNIFAVPLSGESGSNVEQLVFHGRNNNAANAYGNYIVYSSRESSANFPRNTFNLYLISTQNDFIRRLSSKGTNQMPRFSHDGQTIMYIKHEGRQSSLGIIRLNYNKTILFPLSSGMIQSIDW